MTAKPPFPFKSDFLQIMWERGFLLGSDEHGCNDYEALDQLAHEGGLTAYIGFDATAPSLHVGSLMQIMRLRWLQKTGNRPIALMGGGTTKVGDPSGKDESRKLLTEETIAENLASIRSVFETFLTFGEGKSDAVMVNNADWLDELEYIPFLRDYGRHFSINRMLTFESVKARLEREQTLSFLEFNYMILQAYDFLELYRRHGCRMQMGGSDQWGNILNGVELARRVDGAALYALVGPLITTASGAKMGKTASGAIWLKADLLSPYDYWQFWRNTEDADVGRFLRLFTELPMDEIARLEALEGKEINDAKKTLATEATALLHGAAEAEKAARTAEETFEKGGASAGLPVVTFSAKDLKSGAAVIDVLTATGITASKGEARRLIKGGGLSINDAKVSDEAHTLKPADAVDGQIKVSSGKKKHWLVKLED